MTQTEHALVTQSPELGDSLDLGPENKEYFEDNTNLGHYNRNHVAEPLATDPDSDFENELETSGNVDSNVDLAHGNSLKGYLEHVNDMTAPNEDSKVEDALDTGDLEEDLKNRQDKADDLPEGWVRVGKGVKTEFLNTPRGAAENSLAARNLLINFTNRSEALKPQNSLQNALMSLDRSAVKELKGGLVAIKANRPQTDQTHGQYTRLDNRLRNLRARRPEVTQATDYSFGNTGTHSRRSNTGTKANKTNLVNLPYVPSQHLNTIIRNFKLIDYFSTSRRDNTFSNASSGVETLKALHQRELDQTKQALLAHVEDLVRKYRELAVDAVNAARSEQKKRQEECKQAYSTAYNACLKYETDLKNTIKFALKEYQNSNKEKYESVANERTDFLNKYQNSARNKKEATLANHKLLREDLAYDYQVAERELANFEPKVLEKFNNLVNQLSLFLHESYGLGHRDASEFVKSVVASHLG